MRTLYESFLNSFIEKLFKRILLQRWKMKIFLSKFMNKVSLLYAIVDKEFVKVLCRKCVRYLSNSELWIALYVGDVLIYFGAFANEA